MMDVSLNSKENGFGEFIKSKQEIESIKAREDVTKEFIKFYNSSKK